MFCRLTVRFPLGGLRRGGGISGLLYVEGKEAGEYVWFENCWLIRTFL